MAVALKEPAQMGKTVGTERIIPGITGKPGKIKAGSAMIHAPRGSGKTADSKSNALGIGAGMLVLTADIDSVADGGNGMTAHFADNVAFAFFRRARFRAGFLSNFLYLLFREFLQQVQAPTWR